MKTLVVNETNQDYVMLVLLGMKEQDEEDGETDDELHIEVCSCIAQLEECNLPYTLETADEIVDVYHEVLPRIMAEYLRRP